MQSWGSILFSSELSTSPVPRSTYWQDTPTLPTLALLKSFFFFFFFFVYLFLAALGLRFCVRAFSSCGKRGPLFIAVHGPLTIVASLVAEHRLQTRRLSNCGSRAQLLRGVWDLPRPGLEPMSPALAGRFSTTAPPGKPNTPEILFLLHECQSLWVHILPSRTIHSPFSMEASMASPVRRLSPPSDPNIFYLHFLGSPHCSE